VIFIHDTFERSQHFQPIATQLNMKLIRFIAITVSLAIASNALAGPQKPTPPDSTALLVIDMQNGILQMLTAQKRAAVCQHIAAAIHAARESSVRVIFVEATFRPGAPEIGTSNKYFSADKEVIAKFSYQDLQVDTLLHPLPTDIIVYKHRLSAFKGTDLDMILKANNISHLILTGMSTSGAILSTVRDAADMDYRIIVLSDGTADRDEESQLFLTGKIFPRQADVLTIDEWIKHLK
jgi:nicotinamidase-related amidase